MKTPKPAGGWASRSTSSFSATIWSRASLRVRDQALVLGGDRGQVGLQVGEPLLEGTHVARGLGEPRRRTATSSSRALTCCGELVARLAGAPSPEAIRGLARRHLPSGALPSREPYPPTLPSAGRS